MRKLFIIGILSTVVVAATAQGYVKITEEQKQRIIQHATMCAEQNLIDKTVVHALKDGQFSNVDQKVRCFTNCFFEKAGFLVDGQLQKETVLRKLGAVFGDDKVRTAMIQCNVLRGADNCETAFELYKCFFQAHTA